MHALWLTHSGKEGVELIRYEAEGGQMNARFRLFLQAVAVVVVVVVVGVDNLRRRGKIQVMYVRGLVVVGRTVRQRGVGTEVSVVFV